ncbi:hypothetical protein HJG54_20130 [Leptolyngbya sp. NK1-12]|uniref:Transmembrane protein n=1 Tax=Leptolyngbya sp. NK1-12 TaxID=2547451 RepID=A0AA97AH13_9CYAN|nr:hypothetical protein [Leptolyngbya sp. NK1-12]WNZ24930.1 hypothetical protein HJG54_20130 [Leptolyngbya sp. NK1-12]
MLTDNQNRRDLELDEHQVKDLNRRLGILDHKCSALLELSSVVLALNIIPAVSGNLSDVGSLLSAIISVTFLVSSLLSLFVLWIDWQPTEQVVEFRTSIYRFCIFLTAIGLTAIAALMLNSLHILA